MKLNFKSDCYLARSNVIAVEYVVDAYAGKWHIDNSHLSLFNGIDEEAELPTFKTAAEAFLWCEDNDKRLCEVFGIEKRS